MTYFEDYTKDEDSLIELMFELNDEMPVPLCSYCLWDKLRTPTGRMTLKAKRNCASYVMFNSFSNEERRQYCRQGVKEFLRSQTK